MDPSIVHSTKKVKTKKAPKPPNPFTGEADDEPEPPDTSLIPHTEEELAVCVSKLSISCTYSTIKLYFTFPFLICHQSKVHSLPEKQVIRRPLVSEMLAGPIKLTSNIVCKSDLWFEQFFWKTAWIQCSIFNTKSNETLLETYNVFSN